MTSDAPPTLGRVLRAWARLQALRLWVAFWRLAFGITAARVQCRGGFGRSPPDDSKLR